MIEMNEQQVKEAFNAAKSDEVKGILKALFPTIDEEMTKKKPTLDDYTSITSYEDACEALGEEPVLKYVYNLCNVQNTFICRLPKHIIALMKLETISRALWGRDWEPLPDAECKSMCYYPWLVLWTQKEIDKRSEERKGVLLSAGASDGVTAGFGCLGAYGRASDSFSAIDFRLCQETEEKAAYFGGRNFVKLWAEYLQFNFEVGDFIIE